MLITGVAFAAASCSSEGSSTGTKGGESKMAYYVQDSIMTQLEYFVENNKILEEKAKDLEQRLTELQQKYQVKAESYQRQMAAQLLSPNSQRSKETELQEIQNQLYTLQQAEGAELQFEEISVTEKLHKKLDKYAKAYAREHGYTAIFAKQAAGGQVVYMDASMDITMDFIQYMNEEDQKGADDEEDGEEDDKVSEDGEE